MGRGRPCMTGALKELTLPALRFRSTQLYLVQSPHCPKQDGDPEEVRALVQRPAELSTGHPAQLSPSKEALAHGCGLSKGGIAAAAPAQPSLCPPLCPAPAQHWGLGRVAGAALHAAAAGGRGRRAQPRCAPSHAAGKPPSAAAILGSCPYPTPLLPPPPLRLAG